MKRNKKNAKLEKNKVSKMPGPIKNAKGGKIQLKSCLSREYQRTGGGKRL
jgi:hypothetical protein